MHSKNLTKDLEILLQEACGEAMKKIIDEETAKAEVRIRRRAVELLSACAPVLSVVANDYGAKLELRCELNREALMRER